MSAKRPRPAIPVLVHVDNPAEVGSVTVDTSTIEGKMDTVINNQERIYNKIPTSAGGGSADLTTVNANTTALVETIGPINTTYEDENLLGKIKNIALSVGTYGGVLTESATGLRSLLYNVRQSVGDSTKKPSATETTVRGLLTAIKENTASGDDLTTVNEKITAINAAVGDGAVLANDQSLIGLAKGIKASLGSMSDSDSKSNSNIKGRLYNIQSSIGDALNSPSPVGTSVRDLLAAIKQNTASSGSGGSADLTTVNEKTTALATAIGSASDDSSTVSVIGLLKSITDKY